MVGKIYKITNRANGKVYIGQTVETVDIRFKRHLKNTFNPKHSKIVLYKAFRKYSVENFKVETIWEGDPYLLNDKEIYFISFFNSELPNGYNMTKGGEGSVNRKLSEDTKNKISKAHTGKKVSEEQKQIYRDKFKGEGNPNWGKHHSKEAKVKQSECKKDKTIYRFIHPIHGIEECTQYELRTRYSLTQTCISDLCNKKQKQHKEWRIYYG